MSDNQASLPVGWQRRTLADMGEWSGGQTPYKSNPLYWQEGNILWVSPKDITGSLIVDSGDKITSLALANTRLRLYPIKSIMVVVRSGILRHRFPVTRCTKPFTVNQDLKVLIPYEDVDPQFIFCMLSQLGPTILSRVVKAGTTVESVDIPVFLSLDIPTPPPQEQRKIARILTTVDNLIERTEALIAKFQAIKQGMMHDLFTRGVDEHGHLRPPYQEAPELYKQSELGWIPKEWEVTLLGNCLKSIDAGWSPECIEQPPALGEWGVLKVSAVTSGEYKAEESKTLPSHFRCDSSMEVWAGDVLLARSNGVAELVGVTVQVNETRDRLMLSDKVLRLNPNATRLHSSFLAFTMKASPTRKQVGQVISGSSGQRNISQAEVRNLEVVLPPLEEQQHISSTLRSAQMRVHQEVKVVAELQQIKSGLMQDLLTGKVRVKVDEADEVVHV